MHLTMEEKKVLYAFGCQNLDFTKERLIYVCLYTVDASLKKSIWQLRNKLIKSDICRECYRNMYLRIRKELSPDPDNDPVSGMLHFPRDTNNFDMDFKIAS